VEAELNPPRRPAPPTTTTIVTFSDPSALARAVAEDFRDRARDAVAARGRFVAVLAGGSTPRATYRALAAPGLAATVPWRETILLFGDERSVGPDHSRSNYRMVRAELLDRVPIPSANVHRMRGELAPEVAAVEYEDVLAEIAPVPAAADGATDTEPRFDLVLLGLGPDGHTASLFPGTAALDERHALVVAQFVPQQDEWRLTLTLPALTSARHVAFLVTGADKAQTVAEVFGRAPHHGVHPAERVVPTGGTRAVFLDAEAAALLESHPDPGR